MDIKVTVDKRTELLGILMLIGNYKNKYPHLVKEYNAKDYYNKIHNYFDKFSNDKTVLLFNEIVEKLNFCYGAPVELFLQLNKDFSFNKKILNEYPFVGRLRKSPIVIEMLKGLKSFAKEIKFNSWYMENEEMYNIIIKEVQEFPKKIK